MPAAATRRGTENAFAGLQHQLRFVGALPGIAASTTV
jgi:hypothetical protein